VTVTFSEEVRITSYDESVFPTKEPSSRSETFRFSGGQLENGARFSVSWTPSTAEISNVEWETTGASAAGSTTGSNVPLTYEEIMAQIAHYPGPDDPLYVPAEGEQIWLTDLEGHADIYDNDSIKINYAPSFDKSQITKIEVYRNDVKMRFLPALFDVLTNEQMKTFDGNPAEHTPKSSHTDHAVMGFKYSLRAYIQGSSAVWKVMTATVRSPVRFSGQYAFAHVGHNWWQMFPETGPHPLWDRPALSTQGLSDYLDGVVAHGFGGIQVGVYLFTDSLYSNEIFPIYGYDLARIPEWQQTPRDSAIRTLVSLAHSKGLQAELHLEVWITEDYKRSHPDLAVFRGLLKPGNVGSWFESLTQWAVYYAQLAEELKAEYFCPFDEFDSMEKYTGNVKTMLGGIDSVYSGKILVGGAIHKYIFGWFPAGATPAQFWDYPGLIRGENCWTLPLDASADQRLSTMATHFYDFWQPVVSAHGVQYPATPFFLSAVGFYNWDGQVLGLSENPANSSTRDDQEVCDSWAAAFIAAAALELDGISVWDYNLAYQLINDGNTVINQTPIIDVIEAFLRE
jgi:hypothetical protein